MLLYIGVALWPLVVEWIYEHRPFTYKGIRIKRNVYVVIAIIPMFIMLAFRSGEMGADTGTYMSHFTRMINLPLQTAFETSRMETGYLTFVKLITHITHNPLFYQVICVICMFIGFFDFCKQIEDDVFLFLYFYCTLGLFMFMFTGTRQCIAMSICLFSYKYLKGNYIKFLLCVALAFCFHKSAILFLIVLLIYKRTVNWFYTLLYIAFAIIAGQYLAPIQTTLNEWLDYTYEIEATDSGWIFLAVVLLLTVFSLILIYNRKVELSKDNTLCWLVNINFITLFFWVLRLQTRVAERPSYYFLFFSCALYASALNLAKDKKKQFFYKFVVCGFALLLYIYRLQGNYSVLIPYEFYS